MTVALSLLLGSGLVGWLAPRYLRRITDPVVALVSWLLSILGVVTTAAVAVILLLLPDHGFGPAVVAALHYCLESVQHGSAPSVEATSGLIGVVLLLGLAARLLVVGVRSMRRRARARRDHLAVLRIAGRRETGSHTTLWLDHDRPLAFSLAGRPGVVVATEGLSRHLTAEQVDAVLTHERAHLDGRHHQLVTAGDVLAATLPFLPLFKRASAAIRELVELAADAAAVRVHGAATVREALLGVSGHDAPGTALAMGKDGVEARLARLRCADRPSSRTRRLVSCGVTGTAALILPALTASGALVTMMMLSCPLI